MVLHWLDDTTIVQRQTYSGDKSSFATVFTNVPVSVQQNDVGIAVGGGGYVSRTYTIFTDDSRDINPKDILVVSGGSKYSVLGVKLVESGTENYQQIDAEEFQA